jgi:hypothetical protein
MNEDRGRLTDEKVAIEEAALLTDAKATRRPTSMRGGDTPQCRLDGPAYTIGELPHVIGAVVSSIGECRLRPKHPERRRQLDGSDQSTKTGLSLQPMAAMRSSAARHLPPRSAHDEIGRPFRAARAAQPHQREKACPGGCTGTSHAPRRQNRGGRVAGAWVPPMHYLDKPPNTECAPAKRLNRGSSSQ